jgi:hypothetical protein
MKNQLNILDERLLIANLINKNNERDYNILMDMYYTIADIPLKANDFGAFQLKLQWFINAIESNNIDGNQLTFNPVVDSYILLTKKYGLDKLDFINILEAKNIDLDNVMFNNQQELINYAKNTGGLLFKNLAILTQKNINLDIALKAGELFAIIGIIVNYNFLASKSIYSLLYSHGDSLNDSQKELQNNVLELCKYINKELINIKLLKKSLNKDTKTFLLINIFTKSYLKTIEKADFNLFNITQFKINFINYLELLINFLFKK